MRLKNVQSEIISHLFSENSTKCPRSEWYENENYSKWKNPHYQKSRNNLKKVLKQQLKIINNMFNYLWKEFV